MSEKPDKGRWIRRFDGDLDWVEEKEGKSAPEVKTDIHVKIEPKSKREMILIDPDELESIQEKAEKWDGYNEILKTAVETAKRMELNIEEDPLKLPATYLKTCIDYIAEAARAIKIRKEKEEAQRRLDKISYIIEHEVPWSEDDDEYSIQEFLHELAGEYIEEGDSARAIIALEELKRVDGEIDKIGGCPK